MQCQELFLVSHTTMCDTSRTVATKNSEWSEGLAIGSPGFIDLVKAGIGVRGVFRKSKVSGIGQVLKETPAAYVAVFAGKMTCLRGDNRNLVI